MKKTTAKDLVYMALCVALNAVCAWITFPSALPFTLQTFSVFFTLLFLGDFRGSIAVSVYLLLGLVGVPVFSGFRGTEAFFEASGGYLAAFFVVGWIFPLFLKIKSRFSQGIVCALSLLFCYCFGTLWLVFVVGTAKSYSFVPLLTTFVLPYLLPDCAKIVLAFCLNRILKKRLKM